MKLKFLSMMPCLAIMLLGLAGPLSAPAVSADAHSAAYVESGEWNFRSEAHSLLKEIQSRGIDLKQDAATLEAFRMSTQLSWRTHANYLTLVKDHINTMGAKLERLQQIRHLVEPWQQNAIDRLVPVAVALASHTQAALVHVNDNMGYLFARDYTGHLESIAVRADQMKEWVDTFLELPKVQKNLERLESKISESEA